MVDMCEPAAVRGTADDAAGDKCFGTEGRAGAAAARAAVAEGGAWRRVAAVGALSASEPSTAVAAATTCGLFMEAMNSSAVWKRRSRFFSSARMISVVRVSGRGTAGLRR